jgi:hypothetical protein
MAAAGTINAAFYDKTGALEPAGAKHPQNPQVLAVPGATVVYDVSYDLVGQRAIFLTNAGSHLGASVGTIDPQGNITLAGTPTPLGVGGSTVSVAQAAWSGTAGTWLVAWFDGSIFDYAIVDASGNAVSSLGPGLPANPIWGPYVTFDGTVTGIAYKRSAFDPQYPDRFEIQPVDMSTRLLAGNPVSLTPMLPPASPGPSTFFVANGVYYGSWYAGGTQFISFTLAGPMILPGTSSMLPSVYVNPTMTIDGIGVALAGGTAGTAYYAYSSLAHPSYPAEQKMFPTPGSSAVAGNVQIVGDRKGRIGLCDFLQSQPPALWCIRAGCP